jgi:hypothetical protein
METRERLEQRKLLPAEASDDGIGIAENIHQNQERA